MSESKNHRNIVRSDSMPKSKLSGIKLGIITCAHGNAKAVKRLRKAYEKENVDAIVLAGDLGDTLKEINAVLKAVTPARVLILVFPGSHESKKDYNRALLNFKKCIDGTKKRRTTINGYDLVTLPGSSVNIPTASFRIAHGKISRKWFKKFRIFLIEKLKRFIRKPAKTIVLCHDPPRCAATNGIDAAYSGIARKAFLVAPKHMMIFGKELRAHLGSTLSIFEKGNIAPEPFASKLAKLGYPIIVKHRNVGNKALKAFLKKNNIPFFACGHIHEAGQRAITSTGKKIKPSQWSNSLWYNAAAATNGKGGILILDNNKGTFKNISVKS